MIDLLSNTYHMVTQLSTEWGLENPFFGHNQVTKTPEVRSRAHDQAMLLQKKHDTDFDGCNTRNYSGCVP